jgi:hypothetical protein
VNARVRARTIPFAILSRASGAASNVSLATFNRARASAIFIGGSQGLGNLDLQPWRTAKLDGQAQINVSLSIDAPPELLALIRSSVATTAYGDLRPDTGVSMPGSAPRRHRPEPIMFVIQTGLIFASSREGIDDPLCSGYESFTGVITS